MDRLETAARANAIRAMKPLLVTDAPRQTFLSERIAANRQDAADALQTQEQRARLLAEVKTLRTRCVESFKSVDADDARQAGQLARDATEIARRGAPPPSA